MVNQNIASLFYEAAKKYPNKAAIIYQNQPIRFADLEREVQQQAAYFKAKGIQRGDRVLIFVPMSRDLYRIVLALFSIGATAVFLDEWVSFKRMEWCCEIASCKAFIGGWKVRVLALFSKVLRKVPIHLGLDYAAELGSKTFLENVQSIDTALITFTTGSTGMPKAAKRTHGFLKAQFEALIEKIEPQPDDVDMPVLPIVLLINLGAGCTSVIADFKSSQPHRLNPAKVFRQIEQFGVNRLVASPFFVKQIALHAIANPLKINTLNKIFTGGAPVFPNEAALYDKAFPEAIIQIVYGSTEAEPISNIDAKSLINSAKNALESGLNVGIPYHKAEVRIISIEDNVLIINDIDALNALTQPEKTIGEIIVKGAHVLRAYFNNDEALRRNKIFMGDDCWHRTGDSGYLENGMLYLTGRCAALIPYQGEILSPFMYENYLQSIKGVEVATILKQKDAIIAFVEAKKTFHESIKNEIQAAATAITQVRFVQKMPRDLRHHSKIDYEQLKKIMG
jgi:olefin beta-lactone synthetase